MHNNTVSNTVNKESSKRRRLGITQQEDQNHSVLLIWLHADRGVIIELFAAKLESLPVIQF